MRYVAFLLFTAVGSAQPASAAPLQPVGKWVVDFGDNRCVAWRNFGSEGDPVHLLIKPSPIGDVIQISVAENGRRHAFAEQEPMKLSIGADDPLTLWQLRYSVDEKQVRLVNLTKEQAGRLSNATALRWSSKLRDYDLAVGPMKSLIKIVEDCRLTLADHWNATPEKEVLLKSGPTIDPPLMTIFKSDDYPPQAISKDQSGMARVVALIDEKGEMADCAVIEPSGIAVLDAQTCIIMRKRGKFVPAVSKDGNPVKGVFTQRIRWEMP